MARFTNIPPIFDTPRADQAEGWPRSFELPDNVPPIVPGIPDTAPESAQADHGRPEIMPDAAQNGDHGQPETQPAPPAEDLADDHANLDIPDSTPVDGNGAAGGQAESIFRADFGDSASQDHPNADLPDQAAIDDIGALVDEHRPDNPQDDDHGQADARPDQAAEAADRSEQGGRPEGAGAESDADADTGEDAEGESGDGGTGEGENSGVGGDASNTGLEQAAASFEDIVGLPLIPLENLPPQFHDDDSEDDLLELMF